MIALASCDDGGAKFDRNSQIGSNPVLPAPKQYLIPPIHVAEVVGWGKNEAPTAAGGMRVQALARDLNHPRNVLALPNGDVLIVVGERALPIGDKTGLIHRMEIPHGRFERHIQLPPGPLELGRRELADGCLVLVLRKVG